MMVRLTKVAVLSCALCVGSSLHAQSPEQEQVALQFESVPSCPDAAQFDGEVHRRTDKVRFVPNGRGLRGLVVRIGGLDSSYAGRLRLIDADGSVAVAREVSGERCDEVASALALVAALGLDPQAFAGPIPEPRLVETAPHGPMTESRAPQAPSAWSYSLGTQLRAITGVDPSMRPEVVAYLGVKEKSRQVVSPAMTVGAFYAWSGDIAAGQGVARLTVAGGRAEVCPLHLSVGPAQDIGPCASFDVGAFAGVGKIAYPRSERTLWLASSALIRFRSAIWGRMNADVHAGMTFPLRKYGAVFDDPSMPIHQVAAILGLAGLSLGIDFW